MRILERVTMMLEAQTHQILQLVSFAQKYRMGQSERSMSWHVRKALEEYIEHHRDEFNQALDIINEMWGTNYHA